MTVNIKTETFGEARRVVVVNSKEFFVNFVTILGFPRRIKFPVTKGGVTRTLYFELLGGSSAIFMDIDLKGYTTSETINKKRNPITYEVDVTKLDKNYLGWHAIQAHLKRLGLGYKRLENVSVKELKALARKAIETEQCRFSTDGKTVRVDICASNLFRRSPIRTQEDTWQIYRVSKIIPLNVAIIEKIKAKGYKYTDEQINLISEIFSQVTG